MKYRLQCKELYAMPNILGNKSQPVHTFRWKDRYASDDRKTLEEIMPDDKEWRIIDTRPFDD